MKKSTKNLIFFSTIIAINLMCFMVVKNEHRKFDYVYLDGNYYCVTNIPKNFIKGTTGNENVDFKKEKQMVSENAPIDFKNKKQNQGASNVLPIGTELYKFSNNDDVLFYKKPENDYTFRTAFKVYGDISKENSPIIYIEQKS